MLYSQAPRGSKREMSVHQYQHFHTNNGNSEDGSKPATNVTGRRGGRKKSFTSVLSHNTNGTVSSRPSTTFSQPGSSLRTSIDDIPPLPSTTASYFRFQSEFAPNTPCVVPSASHPSIRFDDKLAIDDHDDVYSIVPELAEERVKTHLQLQPRSGFDIPPTQHDPEPSSASPSFRRRRTDRILIGSLKTPIEDTTYQPSEASLDNTEGLARPGVPQPVNTNEVDRIDEPVRQQVPNVYEVLLEQLQDSVVTVVPKVKPDETDESLRTAGKKRRSVQKHVMQISQLTINGFFIFATWWWPRYYYILLPFITATVALNVVMVFGVLIAKIKHHYWPERFITPESPEQLVMVIPCYNETKEELLKSLNSLCNQSDIDGHMRTIMIICDGRVRGPGMEKTTADHLLEDIFVQKIERKEIKRAYVAWDQQFMDVVVQRGEYCGFPYYCIVKQQNQGKRDGLIVIRSFLYNFNRRCEHPTVVFSKQFFADMTAWLLESGITHVDHLIGMDADTSFDARCIWNLLQESRYPRTVGVCGYVAVDYSAGNWNVWRLYQSAEYTIAQCLRRLHQSTVTKKVSCLPGCCQLLKICEATCGQEVLIEKFGYCPSVTDGLLTHIRATASEDRNHVCHMLSTRPHAETRQALAAKAMTDVPSSWAVFLSQRRRWTLGATSNDLLLTFAPGVQWFERIVALVNVVTWFLNPFIIASVASFVVACIHVEAWIILCFVAFMLVPIAYYLCIPFWFCKDARAAVQFWAGCACYIFLGPFVNITVLLYACWYMDSFGWGKTRKVVSEDNSHDDGMIERKPQEVEVVIPISTDRIAEVMDAERRIGG